MVAEIDRLVFLLFLGLVNDTFLLADEMNK